MGCLSTCVAKQWVLVLSIVPPWDSRWEYFHKEYCELISSMSAKKGETCMKVDFFYHVKVIASGEDQSSCTIMRCNPVWNTTETMQSKQKQKYKQWFDWVEVDWDDNNGNVYTVPATLDLLYGVVRYCILTKALICLHQ